MDLMHIGKFVRSSEVLEERNGVCCRRQPLVDDCLVPARRPQLPDLHHLPPKLVRVLPHHVGVRVAGLPSRRWGQALKPVLERIKLGPELPTQRISRVDEVRLRRSGASLLLHRDGPRHGGRAAATAATASRKRRRDQGGE